MAPKEPMSSGDGQAQWQGRGLLQYMSTLSTPPQRKRSLPAETTPDFEQLDLAPKKANLQRKPVLKFASPSTSSIQSTPVAESPVAEISGPDSEAESTSRAVVNQVGTQVVVWESPVAETQLETLETSWVLCHLTANACCEFFPDCCEFFSSLL